VIGGPAETGARCREARERSAVLARYNRDLLGADHVGGGADDKQIGADETL